MEVAKQSYHQRYYQEHKEEYAARAKEWFKQHPEERRESWQRWKDKNPDYYKKRTKEQRQRQYLKRKYGITLEQWQAIQDRGCDICGAQERLVMDHDHHTNRLRGGLCQRCNKAIAQDDILWLRSALEYLERHKGLDAKKWK